MFLVEDRTNLVESRSSEVGSPSSETEAWTSEAEGLGPRVERWSHWTEKATQKLEQGCYSPEPLKLGRGSLPDQRRKCPLRKEVKAQATRCRYNKKSLFIPHSPNFVHLPNFSISPFPPFSYLHIHTHLFGIKKWGGPASDWRKCPKTKKLTGNMIGTLRMTLGKKFPNPRPGSTSWRHPVGGGLFR